MAILSIEPVAIHAVRWIDRHHCSERGFESHPRGVGNNWIVNLAERQTEVYRNPRLDRAEASYENRQTFSASEKVPLALGGQLLGEIAVERILP
jgi:hypothetical protein